MQKLILLEFWYPEVALDQTQGVSVATLPSEALGENLFLTSPRLRSLVAFLNL